jgi:hypothetical protein
MSARTWPAGAACPDAAASKTVAVAALAMLALALPMGAAAQSGDGSHTAAVLTLPGGGRAGGMGGAYVAGADVDALFYNPAGASWLRGAASASYQRHVEDIGYATAAGGGRVGPIAIAVSVGFLDYGSIAEIRPDPDYGGQRGTETGSSVDASEMAARATVAYALLDDRLSVGASAGVLWVSVAETGRAAPIFDAGVQYRVRTGLTTGAALRNAGGDLTGAGLASAPLPTEVRAGASYRLPFLPFDGTSAVTHVDLIAPLRHGSAAAAVGVEVRHTPDSRPFAAALRAGYNGASGGGGLGLLHVGAGIEIERFALDYAFQSMDLLGSVHRLGVRWAR